MEKAKAYIKNELRGGSVELTQAEQSSRGPRQQTDTISGNATTFTRNRNDDQQKVTCFVCGNTGRFNLYSVRVRQNAAQPSDPYFPFLENHEPPNGLLPVTSSQSKVNACSLCQQILYEQWHLFERENRPHLQRLYYLKRVDGKRHIGAEIYTQGEFAAQMLGLSTDNMGSSELMNHLNQPMLAAMHQTDHYHHHQSQSHQSQHDFTQMDSDAKRRHSSKNVSPSMRSKTPTENSYYTKKERDSYNFNHYNLGSSNNSNSINQHHHSGNESPLSRTERNVTTPNNQQISRPQSRDISSTPPQGTSATGYNAHRVTYSPFAQHKLKLGNTHYSTTPMSIGPSPKPMNFSHGSMPPAPSSIYDNKFCVNNSKSLKSAYSVATTAHNTPLTSSAYAQVPSVANSMQATSHDTNAHVQQIPKTYMIDEEAALDLRNTSSQASETPTTSTSTTTVTNSSNLNQTIADVGILDLSMPDKNAINEVCYVCGEEYKRGSLLDIATVEPKDAKDRNKPYFPIFNETHPRPARSRPKDPRGMIQACTLCYDHLVKQWNQFRVSFYIIYCK